jgi:hypothetical protein
MADMSAVSATESDALSQISLNAGNLHLSYKEFRNNLRKIAVAKISQLFKTYSDLYSIYDTDSVKSVVSRGSDEDIALTYGEIDYFSFLDIMEAVNPKQGDKFFDLGCGTGKCMIACALNFASLATVEGLEISSYLYNICDQICLKFKKESTESTNDVNHLSLKAHYGDIVESSAIWIDSGMVNIMSCFKVIQRYFIIRYSVYEFHLFSW